MVIFYVRTLIIVALFYSSLEQIRLFLLKKDVFLKEIKPTYLIKFTYCKIMWPFKPVYELY